MNTFLHGLFGAIVWIVRDFKIRKDVDDKGKKKFNFKKLLADRYDNWLFAVTGGILGAYAYGILIQLVNQYSTFKIVLDGSMKTGAEMLAGFMGAIILERLSNIGK